MSNILIFKCKSGRAGKEELNIKIAGSKKYRQTFRDITTSRVIRDLAQ